MARISFLFLFLCVFGFPLENVQSDLEKKNIKTHPIAIKETLSRIDVKDNSSPSIISETIEIYDELGMLIFKLVQKKNQLEKNKIPKIISSAYLRSYNDKRLLETKNIFGDPLKYTEDFFTYSPKGDLLKIITKDEHSNEIAETVYQYQEGFLTEKQESKQEGPNQLTKLTSYEYLDNFQIKSLKETFLSKGKLSPVFSINYDYLNKERDMFYNRRVSINQISTRENKSKNFSYKEILIAKDGFFLKYLLDKHSHVIGKSEIALDENQNVKKVTIYENDLPKYIIDFDYFDKDKQKLIDEMLEKISSSKSKIIGPRSLNEAKEFTKD